MTSTLSNIGIAMQTKNKIQSIGNDDADIHVTDAPELFVNVSWDQVDPNVPAAYFWLPQWNFSSHQNLNTFDPPELTNDQIDYIRSSSNAVIIIWWPIESFTSGIVWDKLVEQIINLNLPRDKVHYVTGNLSSDIEPSEHCIIHSIDYFMFLTFKTHSMFDDYEPANTEKIKHWLYLNGNDRDHRRYLLSYMEKYGLLDKSYWSFVWPEEKVFWPEWASDITLQEYYHGQWEQKLLDQKQNEINLNGNQSIISKEYVDNSCLSIVGETSFAGDMFNPGERKLYLTEKTYKTFAYYQPFILVGNCGALSYLRNQYGIETWPEIIDESYDLEEDPQRRMEIICNEVDRLSQYSASDLSDMISGYDDRLHRNANLFKNNYELWYYENLRNILHAIFK